MVRVTGLEPAHLTALEPKSNVSANFTTPAYLLYISDFLCCKSFVCIIVVIKSNIAVDN